MSIPKTYLILNLHVNGLFLKLTVIFPVKLQLSFALEQWGQPL